MKHLKRTVTFKYKPSPICYRAIAEAIHKTLKEEHDNRKEKTA